MIIFFPNTEIFHELLVIYIYREMIGQAFDLDAEIPSAYDRQRTFLFVSPPTRRIVGVANRLALVKTYIEMEKTRLDGTAGLDKVDSEPVTNSTQSLWLMDS